MKLDLLIFAIVIASMPCKAQLTSDVDLGVGTNKSESPKEATTKEITVTGIGDTIEAAEKQALASAIRQAVGAYMDSKTIVENEEVIQDRILSVSNAFVEKYEVVGQPKKPSDGLFEITIIASVKTNQVINALKEQNLISGEVPGQNIWATASTKVMNVQDAVAMLKAKVPELIKSCVTINPVDKDGNPMLVKDKDGKPVQDPSGKPVPSTAPAQSEENAETGEVTLTWHFRIGWDNRFYRETLFPLVKECLDAIYGVPGRDGKMRFSKSGDYFERVGNWPGYPILIKRFSRNLDECDFIWYENSKNILQLDFRNSNGEQTSPGCYIMLELLDSQGDLVKSASTGCWQPFDPWATNPNLSATRDEKLYDSYGYLFNGLYYQNNPKDEPNALYGIGFNYAGIWGGLPKISLSVTIPISIAREVKKAKVSLDVLEPVFSLKSSQN